MEIKKYGKGLLIIGLLLMAGCERQSSVKPQSSAAGCDLFETCGDEPSASTAPSAFSFAREYEAYNGKETRKGKVYRSVSLSADTPFFKVSMESVVQRLKNQESFYLYIGDPMCPWCRSVIEQAESVAMERNITEIASLRIWDENGEEILRDQYVLEDGKPILKKAPSDAYRVLLEAFHDVLEEYTLKNEAGEEISVGEKRIYAPSFFRIEDGQLVSFTTGISSLQEDAYAPLTMEIQEDERRLFASFFKEN